jgi:hypothetical protein
MKEFIAGALFCVCIALIGAIVMIHDMSKPLEIRPAPRSYEEKVRVLCGGENAVIEPAYQCLDKRGRKTRVILEKDLK